MKIHRGYPDIKDEIVDNCIMTRADINTLEKQKVICYRIIIITGLIMCFIYGNAVYYYDQSFISSLKDFFLYIIYVGILVVPLHYLTQCLFYPMKVNSKDLFFGFNKEFLMPFVYCKEAFLKKTQIIISILPFILYSIIPFIIMLISGFNIILFMALFINAILSSCDFYDVFVLLTKIPKGDVYVVKSANQFYTLYLNIIDKDKELN